MRLCDMTTCIGEATVNVGIADIVLTVTYLYGADTAARWGKPVGSLPLTVESRWQRRI